MARLVWCRRSQAAAEGSEAPGRDAPGSERQHHSGHTRLGLPAPLPAVPGRVVVRAGMLREVRPEARASLETEAADTKVIIDLLMRPLLKLGATRRNLAEAVSREPHEAARTPS